MSVKEKKDSKKNENKKNVSNFDKNNKKDIIISKYYLINNKNEVKEKKWFLKKAKEKKGKYFKTRKEGMDFFLSLNLDARLWISKDGKFIKTVLSEKKEIIKPKIKKASKPKKIVQNDSYPIKHIYNYLFNEKEILKISREDELELYQEEMNLAINKIIAMQNKKTENKAEEIKEVKKIISEEIFEEKEEKNEAFNVKNIYIPWVENAAKFTREDEEFMLKTETEAAIAKIVGDSPIIETEDVEEEFLEQDKKEEIVSKKIDKENTKIPFVPKTIFDPRISNQVFYQKKEEQSLYELQMNFAIRKMLHPHQEFVKSDFVLNEDNVFIYKNSISEEEKIPLNVDSNMYVPELMQTAQNKDLIFEEEKVFDIKNFAIEEIDDNFKAEELNLESIENSEIIEEEIISSIDQDSSSTSIEDYEVSYIQPEDFDKETNEILGEAEYFDYEDILNSEKNSSNEKKDPELYTKEETIDHSDPTTIKTLDNDDVITTKDIENYEEYTDFEKDIVENKQEEKIDSKSKKVKNKRKWYKLWLGR